MLTELQGAEAINGASQSKQLINSQAPGGKPTQIYNFGEFVDDYQTKISFLTANRLSVIYEFQISIYTSF
jgi:hypothetical protein